MRHLHLSNTRDLVSMETHHGITRLIIVWVILLPLVYFAGGFWFQNHTFGAAALGLESFAGEERAAERLQTMLVVFPIVMVALASRLRSLGRVCRRNVWSLAIALLAVASSIWSQFPAKSFEWALCLILNTLFALYLYGRFSSDDLLRVLTLAGWICLALSIILAVLFPSFGISDLGHSGAWQGTYDHKNACALMTILFLSCGMYMPTFTLVERFGRLVYVGLSVFLLVMTQSVTGEIALLVLAVYFICIRSVRRLSERARLTGMLVAAVFTCLMIGVGFEYSDQMAAFLGKDSTFTGRSGIWKMALLAILKRPLLGYGYMAFWRGLQGESANASLTGKFVSAHAHNGVLEIWLNLGIGGVALLLYSMAQGLRDLFKCTQKAITLHVEWYGSILIVIAVISIDEAAGLAMPNNLAWILYVIACTGLSFEARRVKTERGRSRVLAGASKRPLSLTRVEH